MVFRPSKEVQAAATLQRLAKGFSFPVSASNAGSDHALFF